MNKGIEVARVVACFGVIWSHTAMHHGMVNYNWAALFFAGLASYFACLSDSPILPKIKYVMKRYVFWGLAFIAAFYFVGRSVPMVPETLLMPSIHLWFLPFLVFIYAFGRVIKTCGFTALSIGLMYIPLSSLVLIDLPDPFNQYVHAIPLVIIGATIGLGKSESVSPYTLFCFVLGASLWSYFYDPAYAIAALILWAVTLNKFGLFNLNPIGRLTFGVYLIHPFLMFAAIRLTDGVLIPIFTMIASLAIVYTMRLTAAGRSVL